ncbi:MAG: phosphotransferase [Chloroflexi bacterium]|nr:phosphotransferase [Chloroflexota bacterium]
MDDLAAFEQVAQKIVPEGKLLRRWSLTGGVSAQVTVLEIEQADGEKLKVVVRQYGEVNLRMIPNVAAHEFRLLQSVQAAGIPAPKPYDYDLSGAIFPTPYIVVEFVPGETSFAPWTLSMITRFAALLAQIHAIDARDLTFLRQREQSVRQRLQDRPAQPDDSVSEGRIRAALEAVWPLPPRNPVGLLHGDYWPGNILWNDDRIAAVIDWEDSALGDPLSDVACARLDLLWAFGVEAMQVFTDHYQSLTSCDFTDLAYWDLTAALRPIGKFTTWEPNPAAAQKMIEKHRFFVRQTFEKLSETSLRPAVRS